MAATTARAAVAAVSGLALGLLFVALLLESGFFKRVYAPTLILAPPLVGAVVGILVRRRLPTKGWLTVRTLSALALAVAIAADPLT